MGQLVHARPILFVLKDRLINDGMVVSFHAFPSERKLKENHGFIFAVALFVPGIVIRNLHFLEQETEIQKT